MMHHQSKFRKTLSFTFVISVLIFSTFAFLNTSASAQLEPTDSLNTTATQQTSTDILANETLSESKMLYSINATATEGLLHEGSEEIVHVVWEDSTPTTPDIFHRRAGGLFDPSARITLSDNPAGIFAGFPAIAISGPEVYVVWNENPGTGNFDIWLKKSEDGGATFGSPLNVSNDPGQSHSPKIAVAGQFVYIVWEDRTPDPTNPTRNPEILFAKSTDRGRNFPSIINLSNNFGVSLSPSIAAPRARHVLVTWSDVGQNQNSDIWLAKSSDGGDTFGSPINVSNDNNHSEIPKIAVDVSNVYIVWEKPNPREIRFIRSTDGGVTFDASQIIGNGFFSAMDATANDNTVYVAWATNRTNGDIVLRRSMDGGATFEFPRSFGISTAIAPFGTAIVASDSLPGNVYVVWTDQAPGNADIYFKRSRDSGSHFEPFSTNLSRNAGHSTRPAIAILALR